MRVSFSFKLYRSKRNRHLHLRIEIGSEIYNHCIALHRRYYRLYKKSLNKYRLQKHLTKLKRLKRYRHWKKLGSQAIQDVTDRIERAYKHFYEGLKTNRKVSPPSFKKRFRYKSFTLKQAGYRILKNNRLQIANFVFKYHKSRELNGKIKTLTVKRDPLGDIYMYFSCEVSSSQSTKRVMTGKSAGFDFGLKTFLKPSDGTKEIDSPLFFKKAIKEIKKANKCLSRKKKTSKNRTKARYNLARVHKKIANQRKDYHFKLALELAKKYDYIYMEELNLKGMQRLWGRKISDLGFSDFIRIQKYYCQKHNSVLHFIDKWFPSSKLCHVCGYINDTLTLKERQWSCPECNTTHDRDENAAINIYREGTSSLGLGDVRPPFGGQLCLNPDSQIL